MPAQPGTPATQVPPGDDALIRRIQEIERQLREIVPSVAASFGPVVADLQAQQATLAAQVADIAALVGAQTVPAVGSTSTGVTPFATSTSATNHAPVTITVPSGYTRAAVVGFAIVTSFVRPHTCAVVIGGGVSDYTECGIDDAGAAVGATILTGLTGGGTFTVLTQIKAGSSGGYCHARTAAQVTFYR